eukprot:6184958-Pleurochrysis_carterae.AAC.9
MRASRLLAIPDCRGVAVFAQRSRVRASVQFLRVVARRRCAAVASLTHTDWQVKLKVAASADINVASRFSCAKPQC